MHAQKTGALSAKSDRSGRRPQAERASVAGKPLTAGSGAQDFPALPACALGSSVGVWMRPENFRSGRRGTRRGLCAWRVLEPKTARRNARPRPWHEYVLWRRRDPAFRRAGSGGRKYLSYGKSGRFAGRCASVQVRAAFCQRLPPLYCVSRMSAISLSVPMRMGSWKKPAPDEMTACVFPNCSCP